MNKHIIIATYDGIGTHYSGVGTIAKNLVFALSKLSGKYNFKVSIAYINVDKSSKVFNRECFQESLDLVKDTGGQIIPLCNTTKGEREWDMWRSFEEWDFTCVSLVISLGKSFAKSMNNDYGLDFNQNDYLQNGLCFEKYHDSLNKEFHNSDLKKYNIHIPDGKKIIFSWGRC